LLIFISQKTYYALKAAIELAQHSRSGKAVKVAQIAQSQDIPPKFLEAILTQLKWAQIVTSTRGAAGGYHLKRAPAEISAAMVINAVQGPLDIVGQVSKAGQTLSSTDNVLSAMFRQVEQVVDQVFGSLTLQELIDRQDELLDNYVARYTI